MQHLLFEKLKFIYLSIYLSTQNHQNNTSVSIFWLGSHVPRPMRRMRSTCGPGYPGMKACLTSRPSTCVKRVWCSVQHQSNISCHMG